MPRTIRTEIQKRFSDIDSFRHVNNVSQQMYFDVGKSDFFDRLLRRANVVTTPGAGFGPSGEGYVRLTAFGDAAATVEAVERVKAAVRK